VAPGAGTAVSPDAGVSSSSGRGRARGGNCDYYFGTDLEEMSSLLLAALSSSPFLILEISEVRSVKDIDLRSRQNNSNKNRAKNPPHKVSSRGNHVGL